MNRKVDNELLNDVFAENTPADFREAMLGETLRLARRRRHFRQTRNAFGVFAALALLGIFIRQETLPQKTIAVSASSPVAKITSPKSYEIVHTRPLPASVIVTTHSLSGGQFLVSAAEIKIVRTTPGNFRVINDDELLALIAPRPAILLRTGKNSEELVFANPEDAKGFPLN
jgi:hypothetical protein